MRSALKNFRNYLVVTSAVDDTTRKDSRQHVCLVDVIDRKLQPQPEVFCHYFVYKQRPEDRILQVLVRKTETIKEELGSLSQVIESDGTLIVNIGKLDGGTLATAKLAGKLGKPYLVLQLDLGVGDEKTRPLLDWLRRESIVMLNVAGPRESKRPGIYALTYELLDRTVKPA